MTPSGWLQIGIFAAALALLGPPLGRYLARVLSGERVLLERLLGPVERSLYRLAGVDAKRPQTWKSYAFAFLASNLFGLLIVYALQRFQASLPLNPAGLGAVTPHLAFNTAVSFATNTNWQSYGGETTLSHLVQMLGLTVQNFLSAAAGIAVLAAFARGFVRKGSTDIGNYWVDLVRTTFYVLVPLSLVVALALVSQGVVQTLDGSVQAALIDSVTVADGAERTTQTIAIGPAASQIAIKQLGTNGGGFFNVNSAHPLENPTPLSNLLQLIAILLLPIACCTAFGRLVNDARQGRALLLAMTLLFVPFLVAAYAAEQSGNPLFERVGLDVTASDAHSGGNMEGKETRFGIANSALWAATTTAASNGSVNAMHDSLTPLGGLVPLALMLLGEVVFGGVGSGLYGLLLFALFTVFLASLMVGRTPEYLGKKIEAFEVKMATIAILAPAFAVLICCAIAVSVPSARASIFNPGAHGFSEVLYAFASAGNNNGSALGGLGANTPFFNTALGIAMLVGRYGVAIPVLAIAGSLVRKKQVPVTAGTLATHDTLFVALLCAVVVLVGALTFVPALALGPIVEHMQMVSSS